MPYYITFLTLVGLFIMLLVIGIVWWLSLPAAIIATGVAHKIASNATDGRELGGE